MQELEEIKRKSLYAIFVYIGVFYLVGTIILMVITKIVSTETLYDYKVLLEAMEESTIDQRLNKIATGINVYGNLLIYVICAIFLLVLMYKVFIIDLKKYKSNLKKNVILSISLGIVFYLVVILVDFLTTKIGVSENQSVIENAFSYKCYIPQMIIFVVILGPLIEELIFRKAIFNLCSGYKKYVPIIISAIAFALPHMLSTTFSYKWFIMLIPYLSSGLMLGGIYTYSKENIYYTLIAHVINNLGAVIMIFV